MWSDPNNPFPGRVRKIDLAFFLSKAQFLSRKGREDLRGRFMGYDL